MNRVFFIGRSYAQKRILVVDDDEGITETMKDILEVSGYKVDTASSGASAVGLFKKNVYDAVLMDLKMPGMSGITLE